MKVATPTAPLRTAREMLSRCAIGDDGFVGLVGCASWALGAVAHVAVPGAVAMVRKAPPRDGQYEFSGLWALPGGMVRVGERSAPDARSALTRALHERVLEETSLDLTTCRHLGLARMLGPVVSSYTARGERRHTLIVVDCHERAARADLASSARSITEARWVDLPPAWGAIAPANRLIMAHLMWPSLTEAQRSEARPSVSQASADCSRWAAEVGLPAAPCPWEQDALLASWRRGFP